MLSVFKTGIKKIVANVSIYKAGAMRDVNFIRIWKTINNVGAWHDVWLRPAAPPPPPPPPPVVVPPPPPPVTLSVSTTPLIAYGTRSSTMGSPLPVQTGIMTVTPSGGTGPYTYSWSRVSWTHPSNTPNIITPISGDAAKVRFEQPNMMPDTTYSGTFKVIVTDSLGNKGEKTVTAHWAHTQRDWDYGDTR